MLNRWSTWLQSLLYIAAGINHFWHPSMYMRIMPPCIPAHFELIVISGIIEIVLGALLLLKPARKFAAYAIIAMLIAFIPVHTYLIQISHCPVSGFCLPLFLAWLRLLPGQPVLIWWAYSQRNL